MSDHHERYPVKEGPFSSHSQLIALAGRGDGRRLLDVGCAQGVLSLAFTNSGWHVVAIEPDSSDAAAARAAGVEVVEGLMEQALAEIAGDFDCIVAADVLEHMAEPQTALASLRARLAPDGRLIASVPNVAHLAVRAQLLAGSFRYRDRGPLDRTHLRFFTRATLRELFIDTGWKIESMTVTPAPVELAAAMVGIQGIPESIHRVNYASARLWPGGLAYQFLVVASPAH